MDCPGADQGLQGCPLSVHAITYMCSEAQAPTFAAQIHADYLASFQRMQTQFGNGNIYCVNSYDPTTLALKTYAYGTALNSGRHLTCSCSAALCWARHGVARRRMLPQEWCMTL